jgi:uncharacterized protein
MHELEKEWWECLYISLDRIAIRKSLDEDPENLLQLLPPWKEKIIVCLDEIQYLANPTSFLKFIYDEYHDRIKLFVTGSSSFYIDRVFSDSLAGRVQVFELPTLTFREFLRFKKQDWLTYNALYKAQLSTLFHEYLTYWWYPELVLIDTVADKIHYLESLTSTYVQKDIAESGIRHVDKYFQLLQLLAEQTGKLVNMTELGNIVWVSTSAIQDYLYVMQKSFHIGLLRPYAHNIRKEIVRMPKVYFHDAWLRNYCLNNYSPLASRMDKGECLEQYVWQYLQRQHISLDLHFRRSKTGQEVDFIIKKTHAREIRWDKKLFSASKYNAFMSEYPSIELVCKDYRDMVEEAMR